MPCNPLDKPTIVDITDYMLLCFSRIIFSKRPLFVDQVAVAAHLHLMDQAAVVLLAS
jgi:hypothetical protein